MSTGVRGRETIRAVGPELNHVPCDLALQQRIHDARIGAVVRAVRRRRAGRSAVQVPAESAKAAFRISVDVVRALRF